MIIMKNLKIYTAISCFFLLFLNKLEAQTTAKSDIEISPYLESSEDVIPAEAQNVLLNKLGEILTQNGIVKGVNSTFILTANTVVLTKEITPTTPSMQVYTFQTTLYLGNGIDGNLFSSYNTTLKGIGTNQTKAYINAFKNIATKNDEITSFLTKAKAKVIEYYNTKCESILSQVSMLEKTNRYQEALYLLTSVPDVSSSCYAKSNARMESIYKKTIDFDCKTRLTEAQQFWNANPNADGANEAANLLKGINPNSACFKDVKAFGGIISKKMNENDAREWKLYYEQEVGLEKDRIEAIKEIGKAYGQGQPQNVTYNTKYWW
jgi:hypothetical protein